MHRIFLTELIRNVAAAATDTAIIVGGTIVTIIVVNVTTEVASTDL